MRYEKTTKEKVLKHYKDFYRQIGGGIDGYYETTIFDADLYYIYDEEIIGCFSVHETRGLTSLILLDNTLDYSDVFTYVLGLNLFNKLLFTEKDVKFFNEVKSRGISYEIQSYNFDAEKDIESDLDMMLLAKSDIPKVMEIFGEFIRYNNMDLEKIDSFVYKDRDYFVGFGGLEPMDINPDRYCLSMIVSNLYKRQGYGARIVKFLISYVHSKGKEINARCYVKNEISKKTLLNSGMRISNYLYKAKIVT